jgi:hypothetical protein
LTVSNKRSRSSKVGGIGLHAGHVAADHLDGFVQRVLPAARDEDVGSFVDEQLGAGQRHSTCRTCDHRDLAIELSHDHSIHWVLPMLCTPI